MTVSASSSLANVSIGANDFATMVREELCRKKRQFLSQWPSTPANPVVNITLTALNALGDASNLSQTVAVTRAFVDPNINITFTNTTYLLYDTTTVTLSIEGLAASDTMDNSYFASNGL
jgi:hypothetical protein